jgi:hypothetical protein
MWNGQIWLKLNKCERLEIKDWKGWHVKQQWKDLESEKDNISAAKNIRNKDLC